MALDFRTSEGSPISRDIGNKEVQGRLVSSTVQLASFTTNRNAVWAGDNALRKTSYPLASCKFLVNRDLFRFQVGDAFKFTYANYSISEMVCRVLNIEEENLNSENIIITAVEDIFSISSVASAVSDPVDHTIPTPTYTVSPVSFQDVIEAPYLIAQDNLAIIPLAVRSSDEDLGYLLYMSSDGGTSYDLLSSMVSFNPYGTLVREYPVDTYQIDDAFGLIIDFVNDDVDSFESITRQDMLGLSNLAIVGDEIMSIQNITPVDGGAGRRYHLTGVYRGRFDTELSAHAADEALFLADGTNLEYVINDGFLPAAERKFKFVPYNIKETGEIADSAVTTLTFVSRARKPLDPINFRANGDKTDAVYFTDIDLTWSPRVRGDGAGFSAPTTVDKYPTWEGYFEIEVYVNDVLMRTKDKVDDFSWTYTEAMNLADNTTLASEVAFKMKNFIEYEDWDQAETDQFTLTVRRA